MTITKTSVANPGWLRPPLVYGGLALSALGLNTRWPVGFDGGQLSTVVGLLLAVIAIALLLTTLKTFRTADTPFPGHRPVSALITDGPFRYSRNPAYLAFSLAVLAALCIVQTYWLLPALAGAVIIMNHVVIPREEAYMLGLFKDTYANYTRRVRRWL